MTAVIYGNITLDRNIYQGKSYFGPGGSAFFSAKTLNNLKLPNLIVSPYGSDFPQKWLSAINIYPAKPTFQNSLTFENYTKFDRRTQKVFNADSATNIPIVHLPKNILHDSNLLMLATVLNNISPDDIVSIRQYINKEAIIALIAQGLFRSIDSKGIIKKVNTNIEKFLPYIDLVFASEEDCDNIFTKAKKWSRGGTDVIITQAQKGSMLYEKGMPQKFSGFKTNNLIDSTGAGDIFAAAFCYAKIKGKDNYFASKFANATASISFSFHSNNLKFSLEEINKLIGS